MDDVGERTTDRAARADAEEGLGGGIQIRDEQLLVDQNECGRKPVEDVVCAGVAP
jgi:hypothetical protein